jgi:uncharacterized protein YaaR (DUF327 family)
MSTHLKTFIDFGKALKKKEREKKQAQTVKTFQTNPSTYHLKRKAFLRKDLTDFGKALKKKSTKKTVKTFKTNPSTY